MTHADAITARLAAGQNGMLTTHGLNDGGLTSRQIKTLQREGLLVPLGQGIHRHAAVQLDRRALIRAALLVGGDGAVVSHRAAAELHRLEGIPRFRPEVMVTYQGVPRHRWLKAHRTTRLDPADICEVDGFPVTTVPRTLLSLGAVLPFEVVEHAAQVAMIKRQVTLPALLAVLERVGKQGRGGTASLRAVVRQSLPDDRIESLLEQRLVELIAEAGLPAPVLQHEIRLEAHTWRLDAAWPELRLTIEANGHRWHATRTQMEADLARSRALQAAGWAHYAYGWDDVHTRRLETLSELRRIWAATRPERDEVRVGRQSSAGSGTWL